MRGARVQILSELSPFQRDRGALQMLQPGYVRKLLDIFRVSRGLPALCRFQDSPWGCSPACMHCMLSMCIIVSVGLEVCAAVPGVEVLCWFRARDLNGFLIIGVLGFGGFLCAAM